ncbi:hypothetical protein As57867_005260, partial [Aphanomyces stellatus]
MGGRHLIDTSDPCWILINAFSAYPSCSISKAIAQKQVDVAAVKASDCKNNICNPFITALSSYAMSGSTCMLKDTSTGKDLSASALSTVCNGIQAPSLVIPGVGTLTTTTGDDGLGTGAIIGIVVGCLVVIAMVVLMYRRRVTSQQTKQTVVHLEGASGHQPTNNSSTKEPSYYLAHPASSKPAPQTYNVTTYDRTMDTTMSSTFSHHTSMMDMSDLELHRVAFNQVRMVKAVAQGAFGEVWVGEFMGDKVAIKKLLPNRATPSDVEKFIAEVKLVAKIDCPYVVKFLGVAWTRPADMLLVTEFMDGGDLRNVLDASRTKKTTFSWSQKLECALHIAEGLVFLHSMDPMVLHRDLKSR